MKRIDPAYAGYRAGALVARALPGWAVPAATGLLGSVAQRAMRPRVAMVERHLRRVHGPGLDADELGRLVDGTFRSYCRYWIESFRLPGTAPGDVDRGIRVDGYHHVEDALAGGKGVILALPHLGGWEWAAFWLAEIQHQAVTAVVEPVEPPELAEWFVGLREQFGIKVVPLGPDVASECMRALRANEVLCLMCDRDLGGSGVEVEFFGERIALPGGPATLALRTGAPLLPTAVYFDGAGHRGVAGAPLDTARQGSLRSDVHRVTQAVAEALEELIRAAPDQWHLMQPNWPSDRETAGGQ